MSQLKAVQAATTALNELGIDQSEPVDPFEAIEDAGLLLRFQPLKDLLGAVLPGDPGGVLINSARPASLQRYTAAHELGHWYMDQDVLSLDTDEAVFGHPHGEARELDAQVFAAHFLMPLELLYTVARRYGIRRGQAADAEQVYQAARDMHVSYEATVRQLMNTRLISPSNGNQLLKTQPAAIKQRLTGGLRLPNARGDVWIVEHPEDQAEVEAFVGDAILLRLTEYPATGYRWYAEETLTEATIHPFRPAPPPFNGGQAFTDAAPAPGGGEVVPFPAMAEASDVVSLLQDRLVQEPYQAGATAVGGAVTRLVAYTADAPGDEAIQLNHVRPVRPNAPVSRIRVTTHVRGVPEVEFRRRLIAAFARGEAEGTEWDY
ncbi:ImmA/IrrE family metallo-endopeptidase [Pseudarthrobacter oxydans]|uniref:ImmA/IrrE family metallo-endopeptidase n=1 Tax=Pseudarthrobacter oxydans TaxID=1671 RepID=UPI00157448AA|nr:ImmA/IrrE family metallo-endopeptidase [Pseudarthrobacter oxydans]NSX35172.1 ImmA/IrrE family metallo-endopeptidase [Pseudarthrobacter oxydans]